MRRVAPTPKKNEKKKNDDSLLEVVDEGHHSCVFIELSFGIVTVVNFASFFSILVLMALL